MKTKIKNAPKSNEIVMPANPKTLNEIFDAHAQKQTTIEDVRLMMARKYKNYSEERDDGSNFQNALEIFMDVVAPFLSKQVVTFTLSDALYHSKKFNLEIATVKIIFADWTKLLVDNGIVTRIAGCYQEDVFRNNFV